MINWTPEQKEAIDIRGKDILVSAGAGSGKTALLTERLKELVLKDRIDTSRLLVLTFTKAAAAEMKSRFKDKLYNALNNEEGLLSNNEILNQIQILNDANISTIHSFASKMIRRYFQTAEVDPSFKVADQTEIEVLTNNTIDEIFEELFQENEENPTEESQSFIELIDLYGGVKDNETLKKKIKGYLSFLEGVPDIKKWFEMSDSLLDLNTETDILSSPIFKKYFDFLKIKVNDIIQAYKELDEIKEEVVKETKKQPNSYLMRFSDEINQILDLENKTEPEDLFKALKAFVFPGQVRMGSHELAQFAKEKRNTYREKLREIIESIKNRDLNNEIDNLKLLKKNLRDLSLLTLKVQERVDQKKAERNLLTFNDLERNLLKILKDQKVREDIQSSFDYIFIDEFQDVNNLQEEILTLIERENNRFMVGDAKQSIVRP